MNELIPTYIFSGDVRIAILTGIVIAGAILAGQFVKEIVEKKMLQKKVSEFKASLIGVLFGVFLLVIMFLAVYHEII